MTDLGIDVQEGPEIVGVLNLLLDLDDVEVDGVRETPCNLVGRLIMLKSKDLVFLECCFSIFTFSFLSFSCDTSTSEFGLCIEFEFHSEVFLVVLSSCSPLYDVVAIEVAVESIESPVEE